MQEKRKENTEISERISKLLDYLGVTANAFAVALGYKRAQTIYDIINGKSAPSFIFFNKFLLSEYSDKINVIWLLTGQGEIFKTKTPENACNENAGENVGKNAGKRKLQKTPANKQYKITGNTPPIAAEPPTPYLDSQPQQGKGRIIDSSYLEIEIPPERRGIRNMFSGFTDEEIEKAMSEEFVNNVLEMFKTGEAVSPSTMKDTINEIVKQKDAEINELRAKLWQYESTFGSISPGDNKPPALHVDNSDKRNPDK